MAEVDSSESDQGTVDLTDKGKRMAALIGEWVFMRYFFPEIRDRRKHAI